MTSSKCKQCGLVNPFNVTECKRCGFTLINGETPNTPESDVEKAGDKKDEVPGIQLTNTSDPAVCFVCGGNNDVRIRNLKRTYTPNWVWLFLPLGILPAGIIGMAVQVKHSLSLPVCAPCSLRRSQAGIVSWLSIIACVFLIFTTIGFAISFKSWFVFLAGCGLIVVIAYLSGRYERSVNPRYTQFTKQRVEIDVPGQGRILVFGQRADQ